MTGPNPIDLRPAAAARPNWGAESLWQSLEPLLPGLSIEVVERLDSTNSELVERLRRAARVAAPQDGRDGRSGRSDDLLPQLLVATHQTAGRGRLGRRWHATPGASLTFSLALPLRRADWSGLSLAVGLAVVQAFEPVPAASSARLGLKWPNDVMLREAGGIGRKLGGILIESVAVGEHKVAVVGIGLNVQPQRLADPDIPLATLSELLPEATAQSALGQLLPALVAALVAFDREGFAPNVAAYAARDVLQGLPLRTTDVLAPEGVGDGVDADGALRLQADGQTRRVISGEVSVRLAVVR